MSFENFNLIDYTFLTIFLLSIFVGLRRGLVKEVVSIVSWIAAFFIACAFATKLAAVFAGSSNIVQTTVSSVASKIGVDASGAVSTMMVGVCFVFLFVGTLVVGSIVNHILTTIADVPGISLVNRGLGAVFGFVRGYLITLVIIFIVQVTLGIQTMAWTQSQFVQVFQPSVAQLSNLIQPGLESLKTKVGQSIESIGRIGIPGTK
jgi:membrane protein required for colicin V production